MVIIFGCQDYFLGVEMVQCFIVQFLGGDVVVDIVIVYDQVEGEIFDEEFCFIVYGLVVQCVQDGVIGLVCCCIGLLDWVFVEIVCYVVKGMLIDFVVFGV